MKLRNFTMSSSMLWSMSTKETEIWKMWLTSKEQNALLPLYKKELKKSSVRVFAVDASDEERLHLPKSDGNPIRSRRYGWI